MPTLDAATFDDGGNSSTSSFSHTVTGSNTYLLVYVATGDTSLSSIADVSGVTYNTISMSELATDVFTSRLNMHLMGLVAPAGGANTVAVTLAATPDDHGSIAVSYTDVDQSTPIGTAASENGEADPNSSTVSSASGELVSAGDVNGNSTSTLGQDTTVLDNQNYGTNDRIAVQEKAGETTTVLTWTPGSGTKYVTCGVPLKPVAAAGGFTPRSYPRGVSRGIMRGAA